MKNFQSSRRTVLSTGLAVGGLALAGQNAFAQTRRITATAFPGPYEEAARRLPGTMFSRQTGAEIGIQPVLAQPAMAKVIASRGGNPPYDAVILDEATYLDSIKLDVFEPLPAAKMKNLADVASGFGDSRNMGAYVAAHIIGLAYNPKTVKVAPTSWLDLWKPEFKGRVGITNLGSGLGMAFLVEIAKLHGGSATNLDPGFAALRKLLPNVAATAPNPGAFAAMFQQGQIDIAYNFLSAIEPLRVRGVDVALTRPKEGFILLRNSMHIVKGTQAPDLAAAYIDANLDPEVQAGMGQLPYMVFPTNRKVTFGPDLARYARDNAALTANTITDWDAINPQRRELIERFNREIRA